MYVYVYVQIANIITDFIIIVIINTLSGVWEGSQCQTAGGWAAAQNRWGTPQEGQAAWAGAGQPAHHCQGMHRTKRRCLSKLHASSWCCLSSSSSLLRIIAKVCSGPNVGWGASCVLLLDVVCLLLRCASLKPNCWSSNLASQRIIKAKLLE